MGDRPPRAATRAEVLPQEKRLEPTLGRLEIAEGRFTRLAQVTNGFLRNRGDVDGGEVTRAHQAGQFDGVSTVGFDPLPWLLGDQGGRDDPTARAFWGEIARAPTAARAGFIDPDEVRAFGLPATDELLEATLARPDVPAGDDRGVMVVGHISARDRVLRDIHADVERARLVRG